MPLAVGPVFAGYTILRVLGPGSRIAIRAIATTTRYLVAFLASDRAGNTTGADYRVDGGFVATV